VAEERTNLLGLAPDALAAFFAGLGERPFRATQLLKWVYHRGVSDFAAMSDLSLALRERLQALARIEAPGIVTRQDSADGTIKWVLALEDGNRVETVYIPEDGRGTLCVSSQAGCALGCNFCSTGYRGFNRDLTAAEIIGQVWLARREIEGGTAPDEDRRVTNVVLMGMGEPLLNLDNVLPALRLLLDDLGFGLARRRVTLSTAGVVPAIERLRTECPVSLAVSLHAPNDALRDELVPLNRKYPIRPLLEACRRYVADAPKSVVTFEYVMLEGVNDSLLDARELAALLRGLPAKVNLIPFNPFPESGYRRSPPPVVDRFRDVLLAAGLMTITRKTRGEDIDAACGQLVGRVLARPRRAGRAPGVAGGTRPGGATAWPGALA
jgi:23S rRNA (adenine2503-C2)-methyltransferase